MQLQNNPPFLSSGEYNEALGGVVEDTEVANVRTLKSIKVRVVQGDQNKYQIGQLLLLTYIY